MNDLAVSILPGAQLVLESVSPESALAVNITEVQLVIEVCPADAPLVIVQEPAKIDLIEVVLPGGGGTAPAPVVYERRVDVAADDVAYRAEAALGALDEAPAWRIRRISIDADGGPVIAWAGGTDKFESIWSKRASYDYLPLH
jgi:hypothetical protein